LRRGPARQRLLLTFHLNWCKRLIPCQPML
jgi:hypothetical protein